VGIILLFIEGFIGLTLQSMFFRQLSPETGTSSPVIAIIIGFFLGALSLGYAFGGKERKFPLKTFAYNLIFTGILSGIALSSTFISLYFNEMTQLNIPRLLALTIYSSVFVSFVAFFMGQSLPLIMQYKTYGKTASNKGGNAMFISTLGSTLGATLPVIYVTPVIGATATVGVTVALCFIIGLALLKNIKTTLIILPFIVVSMATLFTPYLKGNFTSTAFMDIYLEHDADGDRLLFANGLVMSAMDSEGNNTVAYIDKFHHEIKRQKIKDSEILVLGAGAFMAHLGDESNNHYTYIDIDENLLTWARENFGLKDDKISFIVDDARSYMNSLKDNSVKVILLDVYGSRYSLPEHLLTKEFFEVLRSKLENNGVLMFNAIYDPQFKTKLSRTLHNTVNSVFPYCHTSQVTDELKIANMDYTCFAIKGTESEVYLDDTRDVKGGPWGF